MGHEGPRVGDAPRRTRKWLNRTVFGTGLTSAFGDLSYETTNVVLPGFLAVLGIPAAALGAIEGIADAVASFTKLGAGYIADKAGHRKALVVAGYGLTPVGQFFIAISGGWALILLGRCLSWFGKGIRGPLRDAIIAEAISPETRGRAFGFHRAMDTLGAVVGPVLGIALLSWAQTWGAADESQAFRTVFWFTLIPGTLSMLCFGILVRDDGHSPNPKLRFWSSLNQLPAEFRRYLFAVGIFGMGDFSHSLLILGATQLLTPEHGIVRAAQIAGGFYVLRNLVQTGSSYPIGVAADRFGRRRILLLGYTLGVAAAALMAVAFTLDTSTILVLALTFGVAGLYVAVQEALEPTLTAAFVEQPLRGVGFGALGAVNGVGKLVASTAVGAIWTLFSPQIAFSAACLVMLAGTLALLRLAPPVVVR